MDDELVEAQSALSACGVDGVVAAVERLKGQSHVSLRVDRVDEAPVALRIEPTRGILPPYDLPSEARLLRLLRRAGIPVPEVLGVCADLEPSTDRGQGCLALGWVEGEVMITQRVEADTARAYCETLRRTHTLDWQAAGLDLLPLPPAGGPALRERAEIMDRLNSFGIADWPHISRLRRVLEHRVPQSPPPMLVHGDVNFGNVILRRRGSGRSAPEVAAVLDWEQAHLGDPLSDWGRLAAEDLLGNLDLTQDARRVMQEALQRYGRSDADLHYWTLHQLYKHSSATGALTVLRGWDVDQIATMYAEPTERLLSADEPTRFCA
ncbi:MAG: phosphotransferase family protein [Chloroflexi bacterium]|nr:phosphotransferase family protein [Chloroflexota bacterium]